MSVLSAIEQRAPSRLAFTLAAGAVGGLAAAFLGVPMAFVIGSMVVVMALALGGRKVGVPRRFRDANIAVIGVAIGGELSYEAFARPADYAVVLAVTAFVIVATAAACYLLLRHAFRFDRATAYFSAVPGGLVYMYLLGEKEGGEAHAIALLHALRISFVVLTLPPIYVLLYGIDTSVEAVGNPAEDALSLALMAVCAAVGWPLAKVLRLPAPSMLGPAILSAVLHVAGLIEGGPPTILFAAAQVVVGASIGARFADSSARGLMRLVLAGASLTAVMLAVAALAALGAGAFVDRPNADLILAFAPGGITEITIVALALGADVSFVVATHLLRIFLVIVAAPLGYRVVKALT